MQSSELVSLTNIDTLSSGLRPLLPRQWQEASAAFPDMYRRYPTHTTDMLAVYAFRMHQALRNDPEPVDAMGAETLAALTETGLLLHRLRSGAAGDTPVRLITSLSTTDWIPGAIQIDLVWEGIPLYEYGVIADAAGTPLVKKIQRHRMGRQYRRDINTDSPFLARRKRQADRLYKYIHESLHVPPEAYGLLAAAHILGPLSPDGTILLHPAEANPEIRQRLRRLQTLMDTDGLTADEQRHVKKIEAEISRITRHVDTAGHLDRLGVTPRFRDTETIRVAVTDLYAASGYLAAGTHSPHAGRFLDALSALRDMQENGT